MSEVLNSEKLKGITNRTRSTDFVVTFPVLAPLLADILFNKDSLELGVRLWHPKTEHGKECQFLNKT